MRSPAARINSSGSRSHSLWLRRSMTVFSGPPDRPEILPMGSVIEQMTVLESAVLAHRIRITAGDVQATAVLNQSDTARAIWAALPIEARGSTWGDEIYFGIPV